jgi:NADH dehydrogenase FAD-containing subunit
MPEAKNVVVLGGSFAGLELVKGLAATLPTGFKAVFIEKNSHFNYMFNFPRFSVVQGYEHTAFIPYDGVAKSAPAGLVTRIQDTVVGLTATNVLLASSRKVDYEYLVIATGTSQSLPVQVESTEFVPACKELQSVQETIKASQKIAVVGAGAVGVELATDIKSFYPEKDVTLIHSRGQILNTFGKRLHDHVLPVLRDELDIRVLLNERPQLPRDRALLKATTLTFSDGHEEPFDLTVSIPRAHLRILLS